MILPGYSAMHPELLSLTETQDYGGNYLFISDYQLNHTNTIGPFY